MIFLLWLAALVGVFIASGPLHTAALIVLIVLSIPVAIGVITALGIGALVASEFKKP